MWSGSVFGPKKYVPYGSFSLAVSCWYAKIVGIVGMLNYERKVASQQILLVTRTSVLLVRKNQINFATRSNWFLLTIANRYLTKKQMSMVSVIVIYFIFTT